MCIYELGTLEPPFSHLTDWAAMADAREGKRPSRPLSLGGLSEAATVGLWASMKLMWAMDPLQRPSAMVIHRCLLLPPASRGDEVEKLLCDLPKTVATATSRQMDAITDAPSAVRPSDMPVDPPVMAVQPQTSPHPGPLLSTIRFQALELKDRAGHSGAVISLQFSPNGQYLATSDREKIVVWSVAEKRELYKVLQGPPITGTSLSWSSSGRQILCASNKAVVIWDVEVSALYKICANVSERSVDQGLQND